VPAKPHCRRASLTQEHAWKKASKKPREIVIDARRNRRPKKETASSRISPTPASQAKERKARWSTWSNRKRSGLTGLLHDCVSTTRRLDGLECSMVK